MAIFLTGFMGAGKSHFLRKMQNSSRKPIETFIDLDDQILLFVKKNINSDHESLSDAIKLIGWKRFREIELELFKKYCHESDNCLVSLGGGAINNDSLFAVNASRSTLVWLNVDIDLCIKRASVDRGRPLLEKGEKFVKNLYLERVLMYKKANVYLELEQINSIKTFDDLKKIILKNSHAAK